MKHTNQQSRTLTALLSILMCLTLAACEPGTAGAPGATGPTGPAGPPGPPGPSGVADNGLSVETCVGCHGMMQTTPVGDITDLADAHYIDTDADGPQTLSGYRQLVVTITSVDISGANVQIAFGVTDENGLPVNDIFAGDGRFTIAKLLPAVPASPTTAPDAGNPSQWQSLIERTENPGSVGDGPGTPEQQATAENFTTAGGVFAIAGSGSYTYTSALDPANGAVPVVAGDTMRVAIQLSAGDLPGSNGWCDFSASLTGATGCSGAVATTRDIVQTSVCNDCHGVTTDTKLGIHGGGRTEVEYCVTCHNPGSKDANSGNSVDMTVMIHKIHYGAQLANGYKIWGFRNTLHDYSTVNFTKDIDDCVVCHSGGGADEGNWSSMASREACGSCHDDVNFDDGTNHANGVVAPGNAFCTQCHPATGGPAAVEVVHRGAARALEGGLYAGPNGYVIENLVTGPGSNQVTLDFSIRRNGVMMDLATAPEWTAAGGASRLAILAGWDTSNYVNEGTGRTPAQPVSINGLNVGGAITDNLDGTYKAVIDLPSDAFGTATVAIEGHPAADLDGDGTYSDRIAVMNAFDFVSVDGGRSTPIARSDVIDIDKCNACHDSASQGISLHGNNRTGEMQVCVLCHNADATDINRRPADPSMALDGKAEEAIDIKRMIHQIHAGADLADGIVVYGFGNTPHDFSHVNFIGNYANCETCHMPGTYSTEAAWARLGTSIDTGADVADPTDDLNISPTASVCSSCHDDVIAKDHMLSNGASFIALDQDIQ